MITNENGVLLWGYLGEGMLVQMYATLVSFTDQLLNTFSPPLKII